METSNPNLFVPPSSLERFLIRGGEKLIDQFFSSWEPHMIFLLNGLSVQMRYIIKLYVDRTWNVRRFMMNWFKDVDALIRHLDETKALLFGPSVLRFFDRTRPDIGPLDICVNFDGLWALGALIRSSGYTFHPKLQDQATFERTALVPLPEGSHENASLAPSYVRAFHFRKFRLEGGRWKVHRINVHLVRCEPHRHIFDLHSSELYYFRARQQNSLHIQFQGALMNYISGTHAVAIFSRSTFICRRTFIANETTENGVDQERWLQEYRGRGRPFTHIGGGGEVASEIKLGIRFVGDTDCWTISLDQEKGGSYN